MADLGTPAAQALHLLRQGIDAAGAGRMAEAVERFAQAAALRPDLAEAQANLGLLLVALGRHAEAQAPLRSAISLLPANAALHNALGVAQEALHRYTDAAASYRHALAAHPRLPEAHVNLANCLRRLGEADEAQAHYETAIALRPGFAAAHYNFGLLLQERDRLDEAVAQYRRALQCNADYIEALVNLGNCLKKLGALDEARTAFERVLALRPDQLEAHFNLTQLKTYQAGDAQIDTFIAQRHRLPSLPEQGRVRYWFAAAKMLEDAGRYDESFAAYAEGNRLKHAQTPWDEAGHADLLRRVIASFTRSWVAQTSGDEPLEGPVPIFIVGMPRSGTSLLEQVLAKLPGVHAAGELTDLAEVLQSAAADHPEGEFRFPESMAGHAGSDFRRLGRHYIERIRALTPAATHIVDKLPANFIHLGLIHRMLPHARVVHAVRDPMDACFSCFSQLFSGDNLAFTYELGTLGRYWLGYQALMQHWRQVLPAGRILEMSYESLVADFEPHARRMVAHLGLPWTDACLDFHQGQRPVRTASLAQVRRPIYRSSVARWKPFERHLQPLREIVAPGP